MSQGVLSKVAPLALSFALVACGGGGHGPTTPSTPPVVSEIPLTTRVHMDAATQAAYDKVRGQSGWLLGAGSVATASNAFVSVASGSSRARFAELYGVNPAVVEWEMGEANARTALRDWATLASHARDGGLPWVRVQMNNFVVPFGAGTPPRGGMNDTTGRAAAVLPGGSGNAAYIAYIRQLARELKAVGTPVVLRMLHEGNGRWFWWGGNSVDYVALWRLTFATFADERVTNAIWLWSPSPSCPASGSCATTAFYPGDDVVDILGVDSYFDASTVPAGQRASITALAAIGLDKPIVFGEMGPVARADYWSGALAFFATVPRFRGFTLWLARGWNVWGSDPATGSLIDASTDAATRAEFSKLLADPRVLTLERFARR